MRKMAAKKVPIIFKSFTELVLDNKNNPRLPSNLEGAEQEKILNYMVDKGGVLELMQSIGEKDYFEGEPLLAVASNGTKKFTVVEGNRRLSAVMLLNDPNLSTVKKESLRKVVAEANFKPKEIPIIIYSSRDEILDYLGYRHITGIKEWGPLAKAKYLKQLYERSEKSGPVNKCRELARIIGSQPNYVRKLLCGLNVYNTIEDRGFYNLKEIDDVSFSLITTALSYTNIQIFVGLESGEEIHPDSLIDGHLEELTVWMFKKEEGKTRVGESRNLSKLSMVVASKEALDEFRSGVPLEFAFFISGGAEETVIKAISEAQKKIELAFNYAPGITLDPIELKKLDRIVKTTLAIRKMVTPDDPI